MNPSLILTLAIATAYTGTAQESLDRTKIPQPQGVPRVALPSIQKATLRNGLKLWLVEHHELPTVALNLVIQSGSDHDPSDKPGIAAMTADLLDEGTTHRDALAIADEIDFIGANLAVRSGTDGSFVTLNCLTKYLDKALDVFADVLINPAFPQMECERIKNQRLTALLQQRDRPATIAAMAFNRILYGPDHPYGNDPGGSETSLHNMTRDDLVEFYKQYYRPSNAVMIVVGDVTMEEIRNKLDDALALWTSAQLQPLRIPPTPESARRKLFLVDKPGAAQSEIRIGYPALARTSPDFFAVTIMNRILGGQFSSRLNLNLRERRGFSYGARSSFTFNKQPGPFSAGGAVVTAKTDSSVREFLYEIEKMHREGITEDELTFAKKGISGNFALTFETQAQIAGALQNVVLYGLPDNYYETYLRSIDRVSRADVKRAAEKYLDTEKMAVVVVGDLKVIKGGLEELGVGETVLCDTQGNQLSQ
jgi:zinc protease